MKPNTYKIIQECIETGINLGYNRAFKHVDNPSEEFIKSKIYDAVLNEICEWFVFDDVVED